jgi:Ca2+-binding RTX toxin-like protein
VDAAALKADAAELAQWGVRTIALWSCQVGADANFVALLEELTGARVLASGSWLGRDANKEQLQLGDWHLSELVQPEAWPTQFRLEDLDDELIGSDTADVVEAGEGDDDVDGGAGDDALDGGSGDDDLDGGAGADDLDGGKGIDAIDGGAGADELSGGGGDDVLDGGSGDDVLDGGQGDDVLEGGRGADTFLLGPGDDVVLDFRPGVDRLQLNSDAPFRLKEDGNDVLILQGESTYRIESVSLQQVEAELPASSGNSGDEQDVEAASELIEGIDQTTAADDDTIDAGRGANDIDAGLGDDLVDAGAGDDLVDGGKGDDAIDGGRGDDILIGGFGDDTLEGGAGADLFDLTQGDDVVTDFNPKQGDRLVLPEGQSYELIENGDDLLIRLEDGSTRVLEGVSRDEFARYLDEALVSDDLIQPVETEISLTEGDDDFAPETASDASLKVDALSGNDQVIGGEGDDTLDGGGGDDTLRGGAGADRLLGRAGDDLLIGGDGGDTYVLTRGNDTIEGFSLADDRVLVRKGQLYATEEIDDERGQGLLIKLFDDDENPRTDDPKSSTLLLGIGKGQLQPHNVLIRDGDLEVPYSDEGDIQSVIRGSNQGDATVKTANGEEVSGKGRLNGTDKSDVIAGRGGDDQLSGGGGDDILEGGEGSDTLLGGRGDDWLSGGGDGDVYILSRGNDTIDGFNADRDRIAILEDQQYRAEETTEGLLVHLVDPDDQSIEHTTLFAGVVKADLSIENLIQIDSAGKRVFNSFAAGSSGSNSFPGNGKLWEGTDQADIFEYKKNNVGFKAVTINGFSGDDEVNVDLSGEPGGGTGHIEDAVIDAGPGNDKITLKRTSNRYIKNLTIEGGDGEDALDLDADEIHGIQAVAETIKVKAKGNGEISDLKFDGSEVTIELNNNFSDSTIESGKATVNVKGNGKPSEINICAQQISLNANNNLLSSNIAGNNIDINLKGSSKVDGSIFFGSSSQSLGGNIEITANDGFIGSSIYGGNGSDKIILNTKQDQFKNSLIYGGLSNDLISIKAREVASNSGFVVDGGPGSDKIIFNKTQASAHSDFSIQISPGEDNDQIEIKDILGHD